MHALTFHKRHPDATGSRLAFEVQARGATCCTTFFFIILETDGTETASVKMPGATSGTPTVDDELWNQGARTGTCAHYCEHSQGRAARPAAEGAYREGAAADWKSACEAIFPAQVGRGRPGWASLCCSYERRAERCTR